MDKHEKRKQLLAELEEKTRNNLADTLQRNQDALEREKQSTVRMQEETNAGYELHFKRIAKAEYTSVFGNPDRFDEAWEEIKHELGKQEALKAVEDALPW